MYGSELAKPNRRLLPGNWQDARKKINNIDENNCTTVIGSIVSKQKESRLWHIQWLRRRFPRRKKDIIIGGTGDRLNPTCHNKGECHNNRQINIRTGKHLTWSTLTSINNRLLLRVRISILLITSESMRWKQGDKYIIEGKIRADLRLGFRCLLVHIIEFLFQTGFVVFSEISLSFGHFDVGGGWHALWRCWTGPNRVNQRGSEDG